MIVSEIYFHVVVARGVFSYKYLYFSIRGYVEFKELRRMHEYRHLDIPLRYSSRLLPLTYCLWEIQLLQFFLIKRPVSRKIYQIELETWNLMQIFLDLCWGKQTSEGDKSESHSTDNISIFFFFFKESQQNMSFDLKFNAY